MHQSINDIGGQVGGGKRYSDGDETLDPLEDYACVFRRVDPLRYKETMTCAEGWKRAASSD